MKELGAVIKDIRKSKGLIQKWVAKEAGMSNRYLSAIEKGNKYPLLKKIDKLIKVLDVEPSVFFDMVSKKFQKNELKTKQK